MKPLIRPLPLFLLPTLLCPHLFLLLFLALAPPLPCLPFFSAFYSDLTSSLFISFSAFCSGPTSFLLVPLSVFCSGPIFSSLVSSFASRFGLALPLLFFFSAFYFGSTFFPSPFISCSLLALLLLGAHFLQLSFAIVLFANTPSLKQRNVCPYQEKMIFSCQEKMRMIWLVLLEF